MISRADAFMLWLSPHPQELCGTWLWSQCCLYTVAQTSLEAIALEVDVLGGGREQGGERVGRGELVEMADLQRGFGSGAEALPKALGAQRSWQGCRGGLGWACPGKGEWGFVFVGSGRRGGKSLPSLRPLPGCLCGLGRGQQN